MTEQQALALLQQALGKVVPERAKELATVAPAATLDQLALDSAATIEVVGMLEEQLGGVPFDDDALSKVRTVGDLVALVCAAAPRA